MKVLGLIRDLMFRSKVEAVAVALGVDIGYTSALQAVHDRCAALNPDLIIVDLTDDVFPPQEIARIVREVVPSARLVGFASHVDLRSLDSARQAGFEQVMSRSEFTAKLPALLKG